MTRKQEVRAMMVVGVEEQHLAEMARSFAFRVQLMHQKKQLQLRSTFFVHKTQPTSLFLLTFNPPIHPFPAYRSRQRTCSRHGKAQWTVSRPHTPQHDHGRSGRVRPTSSHSCPVLCRTIDTWN